MKPRIFLGSSGQQEKLLGRSPGGSRTSPTSSRGRRSSTRVSRPSSGSSSSPARSISPRSSSPRTTGRRRERRLTQPPERPHRATTSSSKRAVRGCARHPPHVHPPRERRQAPHRPARSDLDPVRPRHHAGHRAPDQPEAAKSDRRGRAGSAAWRVTGGNCPSPPERSSSRLRLALTISRDRAGALEVAGRSWQADGTLSARYWSEASKERVDPPASSTSGRANVPVIRTLPNSRGPVRSSSRASIAPAATGRRAPTAPTPSTRGPPGSTSVPTR
jgi:hypothetical protein